MYVGNEDLRKLFAEARAIYFAMLQGAITSQKAKKLSKPILRHINATVVLIARKHNVKTRHITFQDLGVNL